MPLDEKVEVAWELDLGCVGPVLQVEAVLWHHKDTRHLHHRASRPLDKRRRQREC